MQFTRVKPEVMSPAGYWPQLRAAIDAGADSVYFGLKHFTARAKVGFSLTELPEVMRTLHARGVRGFVTFNTLVFDHELDEAARALAQIVEAGADALIIQDPGIVKLARQIAPAVEIHGSTQMSITNAEGVRYARDLGVDRVTLARELSLSEIRTIRAAADCELEIFVHGALCVAYSGQCFSSEAWGGRSANRGQCAQACRLPYDLVVDGHIKPLGDARYLLSPEDLYALHHIPEIIDIGISALKIEGRYKDADYVALTTAAYRKAVDEAWSQQPISITPAQELQLEQVYSRGLAPHFLTGTNHQKVVSGRAPRHRGVLMGRVSRVLGNKIQIEPNTNHEIAPLKPGDGVVFDAADWRSPEEKEEGGRLYAVTPLPKGRLELGFQNEAIDPVRIRPGDLLWRTHDPALDKITIAPRRQPVHIRVRAAAGEPLHAEWRVASISTTVQSPEPLQDANQRALTAETLREQFGRLGNTPYELATLELDIAGKPFAPASLLNQLRREAVANLQQLQTSVLSKVANPVGQIVNLRAGCQPGLRQTSLHLLLRTPEQLPTALELRPASITLDYLDLYGLKPSVEQIKAAGLQPRVATPRILKPGEERILEFLLRLDCPLLVRSAGILTALRAGEGRILTGDFSLNAANALSAELLLDNGLERLTPTYDLNAAQVAELARAAGPERIEAVAYQHLPVFHTEHCVFCRFLSTGTSYKDCGRPCEEHRLALRDTAKRSHPVMADVGCRNTVFGAEAQNASKHLDSWRDAGIAHYRLEFVHESPEQVRRVTTAFDDYFNTRIAAGELTTRLARIAPQGITEGSYFIPADYLTLPVLQ
jgi:U32 family peptidase